MNNVKLPRNIYYINKDLLDDFQQNIKWNNYMYIHSDYNDMINYYWKIKY